jgi:hypothetical protein
LEENLSAIFVGESGNQGKASQIYVPSRTFKRRTKGRDRCYDFLNTFTEKFGVLTQKKAKLSKILIITLVFQKNANFFAENCQKSQKIVITTSTPGQTNERSDKWPSDFFCPSTQNGEPQNPEAAQTARYPSAPGKA